MLAVVFAISVTLVPAAVVEGADRSPEEAWSYPKFGFGSQFVFPSGGLSSRVWFSEEVGVEANAILWSNPRRGLSGTASLRMLYRLTPDRVVDFYLAGGGAYNLGSSGANLIGIGTGGISFEVFSRAFVLNLEFGLEGRGINRFGMTFGSGFHYYF